MKVTAGVDEVGRGSLIGPVYAAAVILNRSINIRLLKDSKLVAKDKRELLSNYIKKKYNVLFVDMITDAGPVKILSNKKSDNLESIISCIDISLKKHQSKGQEGIHLCQEVGQRKVIEIYLIRINFRTV